MHWYVLIFEDVHLIILPSHIDWHLNMYESTYSFMSCIILTVMYSGLAVVFAEDVGTVATETPPCNPLLST